VAVAMDGGDLSITLSTTSPYSDAQSQEV